MHNFRQFRLFGLKPNEDNVIEVEVPSLNKGSPILVVKFKDIDFENYNKNLGLLDDVAYILVEYSHISFVVRLAKELLIRLPCLFPEVLQKKLLEFDDSHFKDKAITP